MGLRSRSQKLRLPPRRTSGTNPFWQDYLVCRQHRVLQRPGLHIAIQRWSWPYRFQPLRHSPGCDGILLHAVERCVQERCWQPGHVPFHGRHLGCPVSVRSKLVFRVWIWQKVNISSSFPHHYFVLKTTAETRPPIINLSAVIINSGNTSGTMWSTLPSPFTRLWHKQLQDYFHRWMWLQIWRPVV